MTWRQFIDTYKGLVTVVYWFTPIGSRPIPEESHELRRVSVTRAEAVKMLRTGGDA